VRAEICFNLVLDARTTPEQLVQVVTEILKQAADANSGFKLNLLPEGVNWRKKTNLNPLPRARGSLQILGSCK
jgi:hypothetical protein